MAQEGNLAVCSDGGEALGGSLYEAPIFVCGTVKSLGADCAEKPVSEAERKLMADLLAHAGVGSARRLSHFHVDKAHAKRPA